MKVLKSIGTIDEMNRFLQRGKTVFKVIKNIDLSTINMSDKKDENTKEETYNIIYANKPVKVFLLSIMISNYIEKMSDKDLLIWSDDLDGLLFLKNSSKIKEFIDTEVEDSYKEELKHTLNDLRIKESVTL